MTTLNKRWTAVVACLWMTGCQTAKPVTNWAGETWIHRDAFGVPHVESKTDAGAVFGWMYARAEDEFAKVEEACFLPLGRNAEILGEEGLAWDRLVHALEIPRRAKQQYASMPKDVRVLCDAAASALNLYRRTHPDQGLGWIKQFEPWHLVAQSYSWHLFQAAETLRGELGETIGLGGFEFPQGSNAWAIAPQRTLAGNALLLINPHLALGEVFEGHCMSAEGLDVAGGAPFGRGLMPIYGHNRDVAWALTVNRPDVVDLMGFVCVEDEGELRVLWGRGWRTLPSRVVNVRVKGPGGLRTERLVFHDTPLGPLVAKRGPTQVAIAVAGLEDNRFLETQYRMARAQDLRDFQSALSLGGFLFHNVVYADRVGHIWYLYGGRIPKRAEGGPGRGIWATHGQAHPWQGYHTLAELPQILNPGEGWLQNCNSSPFTTTERSNPKPDQFPGYLVGSEETDARAERSRAILSLAPRMELADLERLAFDPFVGAARVWIGEIASAWERRQQASQVGGGSAERDPTAQAIQLLQSWDQRVAVDSVASTLFFLWFERYMPMTEGAASAPSADKVLTQVLGDLEKRFGTWRVQWGDINRLRPPKSGPDHPESWPIAGGHGAAGVQTTFLSRFATEDSSERIGYHGSSFVAAIELSNPVRSRSVVPYGQSRHPDSAHFADQAPLYAQGRMKNNPVTLEAVLEQARRSYRPGQE